MACTPLGVQAGLFNNTTPWSSAPNTSQGGRSVTIAGSTLTINGPTGSNFITVGTGASLHYKFFGSGNHLAVWQTNAGAIQDRFVFLVDWSQSPPQFKSILFVSVPSATGQPACDFSAMNGNACLIWSPNSVGDVSNLGIYNSATGALLCAGPPPFTATGQTAGEATATQLIIHYSSGGTSKTIACPLPQGKSTITPASQTFPDVFIGGCTSTPPTKVSSIRNTGTDCLTVNPIAAAGPFSVQSTTKPLPVSLAPNEVVDVTVVFNPAATGNWNPQDLAVTTAPAVGDNKLRCVGKAVPAEFKIGFSTTTLGFGTRPVGTTGSLTLVITNTGSKSMAVSSAGVTADGFVVAPFSTTLTCGQTLNVPAQFTPASEGPHSATFNVTHSAPGSPTPISLTGVGCVANAEIVVPPTAPIDFGQVQQGFRTVKLLVVENVGDGPLTFQGTMSGPDAALFGLPDPGGSLSNPPASRTYTVNPVSPCGGGGAGTGKTIVAVSFIAGVPPKVATASLTLSGHNATNFPAGQTWVFPLTAEITPPLALDVGLVVDRSDSMNQALGSRVKMDAAISASQLFVELLRPDLDDRVAVVRFNNQRNVVVPIAAVSQATPPTQDQIRQKVASDIPPATGLTAIAGGTMMAIHEVETPHPGNPSPLTRAVVVLTDGIENTAFEEPAGTWLSIMGGTMYTPTATVTTDTIDTAPAAWPAGIERYAIGVGKSGQVDSAQLDALTGTSQRVFYVDQDLSGMLYFQLEKYYTQIFMNLVGTQSILDPMYWIAPGDTHEIAFEVLRGDREALIVIYDFQGMRLPFWCVSPKGEIVDPVSIPAGFQLRSGFTSQARVVEFKMPLADPDRYAGTWKVVVVHKGKVCRGNPGTRSKEPGFLPPECANDVKTPLLYGIAIGVGSDFRMMPFVTPGPVYTGEPILLTAMVSEAGLPVTGCTVSVEGTAPGGAVTSVVLRDDGAHQDGGANDGEYAWSFGQTFVSGIYHFKFRATGYNRDGQPVVREAFRDKPVLDRHRLPPGKPPGGRHPGDGERPPTRDCCDDVKRELREATALLQRIANAKK